MKIKVINPNTSLEMTEGIGEAARSVARAGTEIVAVSPEFGPASIESFYDEQVAACGVLDEVRKGEAEGVDAYVIACYGDPGLHAAREMTEKPVIGIAEASFYTASMVAARFSIVSVIPRVRTLLEEMVRGYGMAERIVAIRTTPLYVLDIERDPEGSMKKLRDEVRRSVAEDDAEAVCLGCAGFARFAAELEAELGVPILDGVVCATKQAEVLVELGLKTSKRKTYRPPERKQLHRHVPPLLHDGRHRRSRGVGPQAPPAEPPEHPSIVRRPAALAGVGARFRTNDRTRPFLAGHLGGRCSILYNIYILSKYNLNSGWRIQCKFRILRSTSSRALPA